MTGVRALMDRVRRLEQSRISPWVRFFGTPEEFAADMQRGIDEGRYDPRDMPVVVEAVTRWTRDALWQ